MKILVFGSNGFIGKAVVKDLDNKHEVFCADRIIGGSKRDLEVDLLDQDSVMSVLKTVIPDIVINCAGSVENSEKALSINPIITLNILQSVIAVGQKPQKIIISGSAGEYGIVSAKGPVSESTPLMGNSFYAKSKILETLLALEFSSSQGIPVVVARIFNPIGAGMHPRFLLPNLIAQVQRVKKGEKDNIEVSRLDAKRDFINVIDIASAITRIVEGRCNFTVYNIGSGESITNKQLLAIILQQTGVNESKVKLTETSQEQEPNYATKADISRIVDDLGWKPQYSISETITQITIDMGVEK